MQVIRWDERPSSEKSYTYLLDSAGRIVYKQLSALNNKAGFFTSIYISSPWADTFAHDENLFQPDAHTPNAAEWKKLLRQVGDLAQTVYDQFLRKKAAVEVENTLTMVCFRHMWNCLQTSDHGALTIRSN
ncbi:hypothetical protein [Burkholderia thailandensis]|uniref:hypothetical protein n=1 Tax=Burkholderia thailandensis TaxID=57975 RepID=UPI0021B4839A|nr:hypothetical protein [Burkholderia thailandensis]